MEIKLEHVTKKIKGVPVLQDVTKTFTGGCVYGLSGKNGCGKTMLMRTMAGLIYPTGGAVKINGKTLGFIWLEQLCRTSYRLDGHTGHHFMNSTCVW